MTCTMPNCQTPPDRTNRAGQDVCGDHALVVVTGSYVDDHHVEGGHG